MKLYTISTLTFKTKKEAEDQIQEWIDQGTYNKRSVIYEVDDKTPMFEAEVRLTKKKKREEPEPIGHLITDAIDAWDVESMEPIINKASK